MRNYFSIGSAVAVFILNLQCYSIAHSAPEPPLYDATGTWDYQLNQGWTDCEDALISAEDGTITLVQTGDAFTANIGTSSRTFTGAVKGTRYHFLLGLHAPQAATTQSMIWNLQSSVIGSGFAEIAFVDDESNSCSIAFDLTLQKQSLCVPTHTLMCLQGGRFRVSVDWKDEHGGSGHGYAIPSTDDSGLFWFFNESNVELLIKVLDGCAINNHYWVFFAATTDQEFTVTITDLLADESVSYTNLLKHPADAVTDTSAFATCP